jgi:hypothetical protein
MGVKLVWLVATNYLLLFGLVFRFSPKNKKIYEF